MNDTPETPQYSDDRDPERLGDILKNLVVGPPTEADKAKNHESALQYANFRRDALLQERLELIGVIQGGDHSEGTTGRLADLNEELQLLEGELDQLQSGPQDVTPE